MSDNIRSGREYFYAALPTTDNSNPAKEATSVCRLKAAIKGAPIIYCVGEVMPHSQRASSPPELIRPGGGVTKHP